MSGNLQMTAQIQAGQHLHIIPRHPLDIQEYSYQCPKTPPNMVYHARREESSRGSSAVEVKVLMRMMLIYSDPENHDRWSMIILVIWVYNSNSPYVYIYIYNMYMYDMYVCLWFYAIITDDREWWKTEQDLCSIRGILGSLPAMTSSLLAALKSQQGKGATVTVYPLIEAKWESLWAWIQILDHIGRRGNRGVRNLELNYDNILKDFGA